MTIRRGGSIIAGCVASGANPDNKSITTNSSDQIQSIGVINQNNTTSAIKTWTGTKAQYDALVSGGTVDSNTLYNITDDTDITLTILDTLYPIGSIYITTANTCPLSLLISGSTWTLVSSGIVNAGNIPCKGSGITLGITDGTINYGISGSTAQLARMFGGTYDYGKNVGTTHDSSSGNVNPNGKTIGITTDATKSGIIVDTTSFTLSVNIFRRTS